MIRNHFIGGLAILSLAAIAPLHAANPVLVDPTGTPSAAVFNTVQAAIDSFCVGGVNAGETAPFVINIKTGVGPYVEKMTLSSARAGNPEGNGNLAGDLIIQTDTPGTRVNLQLKQGWSGGNDGLLIGQTGDIDITIRDIIFSPALLSSTAVPDPGITDELVLIGEGGANAIENTYAFYNCIFTDTKSNGDPAITSRAEAFNDPVSTMGSAAANDDLFQAVQAVGESYNLILDNCVFYANRGAADNLAINGANATPGWKTNRMTLAGADTNVFTIHNCVFAYSRDFGIHVTGATSKSGTINITGDDVTAGLDSATVVWKTFNVSGSSLLLFATGPDAANITYNVNNVYIETSPTAPATHVAFDKDSTGGEGTVNASDIIINTAAIGISAAPRSGLDTYERITVHQFGTFAVPHVQVFGTLPAAGGGTAGVTFRDMIFSGPGTGFAIAGTEPYTGAVSVLNSAFVESGPDAIGSRGTLAVSDSGTITADPQYVSKDPLSASAFDVNNFAYALAGTGNTALAGGADYVGPAPASASGWSLYH